MLRQFLRRELSSISVATLCSLMVGIVTTILFALLGPAFETVQTQEGVHLEFTELFGKYIGTFLTTIFQKSYILGAELWSFLPYAIVLLAFLRATLSITQWYLWERTSEKMASEIRQRLVGRYLKLHPRVCLEHPGFDQQISSTLTTDVKFLREYIVHFYGGFPRELIQVILYLATAASLSPKLFLIFVLGVGPFGYIMSRLGKKIRRRSGKALASYGDLSEWLQQRLLGIETIKHYGTEQEEYEKMCQQTEQLNHKFLKTVRVKARTNPTLEVGAVAALVVVLHLALDMVAHSEVSGSVMMSFFSILGIMTQSASKLGRYYNSNKEGSAALSRIANFEAMISDYHKDRMFPEHFHDDEEFSIKIEGLTLSYPGQTERILDSFDYEFKKAKLYCISGPSGAGKSTLLAALLGLLPPVKGLVRFHKSLSKETIGYLPQAINLAPVSIAENIAYPDDIIDPTRLHTALKSAALENAFSDAALYAPPSEEGHSVSGGQLQRIMLARIFYHQYPLVFIDEGTSAIDPENEKLVLDRLKLLVSLGSTVVMIAHRSAGVRAADEVLVLNQRRR